MKQKKVIKILDDIGIITVTEDSTYNDKRECIYADIDILNIKYLLSLEFDSLTNLTSVKLAPKPSDPVAPAFITSTASSVRVIGVRAFRIFLSKVFSTLIKHKIKLLNDKENKFYKLFDRRTYTLYIGDDGTELDWEARAKNGDYIIYADQAGYGQLLYKLYDTPKPNSGDCMSNLLGSYVNSSDILDYIDTEEDEAKTDVNNGDTNFLEETLDCLKHLNLSIDDVICVVYDDVYMSWETFAKNADFRYDSGLGNAEISDNIRIYTKNYIIYRHEYDGAEEWRAIITLDSVTSKKTQLPNDTEVNFKAD
nr:MAG TPA: hypothetical protein [Bacteriophage sp.]